MLNEINDHGDITIFFTVKPENRYNLKYNYSSNELVLMITRKKTLVILNMSQNRTEGEPDI